VAGLGGELLFVEPGACHGPVGGSTLEVAVARPVGHDVDDLRRRQGRMNWAPRCHDGRHGKGIVACSGCARRGATANGCSLDSSGGLASAWAGLLRPGRHNFLQTGSQQGLEGQQPVEPTLGGITRGLAGATRQNRARRRHARARDSDSIFPARSSERPSQSARGKPGPMATSSRRRTSRGRAASGLSVHVASPAERLRVLERERERLVKRIFKKQQDLEKILRSIKDAATALATRMPALLERQRRLCTELSELFSELLAPGRLGRKARKAVLEIRDVLNEAGMLEPMPPLWGIEEPESYAPGEPEHEEPEQGRAASWTEESSDGWRPPCRGGGRSADPAGRKPGGGSAHELFRRLASALHPDRAGEERERHRRTEVMKELNRAYEEGDVARLLYIEARWLANEGIDTAAADGERRLAALERTMAELRDQLRTLDRELREARRADPRRVFGGPFASTRGGDASGVESMLTALERSLQQFEQARDFIGAFRDGKLTIGELLQGPPSFEEQDVGADSDDLSSMMDQVLREILDVETRARRSSAGRRKGAARRGPPPF
jgi:hypothetical protein